MAEKLSTLSVAAFAAAGLFFLLALVLWFLFRIPKVIGDLSGRTARRSIEKMRAANERTGSKEYRGSKANAERGKITSTMHLSKKLRAQQPEPEPGDRPDTGLLAENRADTHPEAATAILEEETTGILEAEATAILSDMQETASLQKGRPEAAAPRTGGVQLVMLEEILLIHCEEVIR